MPACQFFPHPAQTLGRDAQVRRQVPPADPRLVTNPQPLPTKGLGVTAASRYTLAVDRGGTSTLRFVIAGSATDEKAALGTFRYLASNHARLLEMKKAHYAAILERARVRIPDRRLQDVYNWTKVNTEWHVREVPGIGRGLGAGLMEYPWWFSDTYTVQALIATGDFDLAKQALRFLRRQSLKANKNGRIVHELTTNGVVSNPGNTQETAQYILTIGKLVDWTGDVAFAREMYPAMTQGLDWLLADRDQNKALGYGFSIQFIRNPAYGTANANYTRAGVENRMRVMYKFLTGCRGIRTGTETACWPCPIPGTTVATMQGEWASQGAGFQTSTHGPLYAIQAGAQATAVDPDVVEGAPRINKVFGHSPNPFNPLTVIKFSSAQAGKASVRIYNVAGALVRSIDTNVGVGANEVRWNGKSNDGGSLASGVYFYKIVFPNGETAKAPNNLVLVK